MIFMKNLPGYLELQNTAEEALASINVLFCKPDAASRLCVADIPGREWLQCLQKTFLAISGELAELPVRPGSVCRYFRLNDNSGNADSIDMMNNLVQLAAGKSFAELLEECIWNGIIRQGISGRDVEDLTSPKAVDARFYFNHAVRLSNAMSLLTEYYELLKQENELSRLRPDFLRLSGKRTVFADKKVTAVGIGDLSVAEAAAELRSRDIFCRERTFRYVNGNFQAISAGNIRKAEDFFGYSGVKRSFAEHFQRFAAGNASEPLLVSGLPGLGKTQFTMAHVLAQPGLILVLAGPEELEKGLEKLLGTLSCAGEHRFVVFFDDIDPDTLDWYWFRTNVGGALAMPENVMIALAANYDFPASILSRGRGITFPVFDVVRCEEMVEDFLKSKGLMRPSVELVGVIAADYTEEFGQKKFPELSPRTLVRYLGWYDKDMNKRRRLLEQSKLELVSRPDAQLFQEFNLKQIKLLYGGDKMLETIGEGING